MTATDEVDMMSAESTVGVSEVNMSDAGDTQDEPATSLAESSGLDGLPVSLEISLPTITLPLGIVKDLAGGTTVPLGLNLSELMQIGINGQIFGHGSFVQIGDQIGIQIESWKPVRSI